MYLWDHTCYYTARKRLDSECRPGDSTLVLNVAVASLATLNQATVILISRDRALSSYQGIKKIENCVDNAWGNGVLTAIDSVHCFVRRSNVSLDMKSLSKFCTFESVTLLARSFIQQHFLSSSCARFLKSCQN